MSAIATTAAAARMPTPRRSQRIREFTEITSILTSPSYLCGYVVSFKCEYFRNYSGFQSLEKAIFLRPEKTGILLYSEQKMTENEPGSIAPSRPWKKGSTIYQGTNG
jgi:hypothetical protein